MRLFIFRHDLRLQDNTAFIRALQDFKRDDAATGGKAPILPLFIFPPEQIDPRKNKYFSNNAVQFMCESLLDLDAQLREHGSRLFLMHGDNCEVLKSFVGQMKQRHVDITGIYFNQSETVYALHRDAGIAALCQKLDIPLITEEDYGLTSMESGRVDKTGKPYTILAQYYKRFLGDEGMQVKSVNQVSTIPADALVHNSFHCESNHEIQKDDMKSLYSYNSNLVRGGGRTAGLRLLSAKVMKAHKDYDKRRDFPADEEGTTRMSPHLRFGTVSIREMYWAIHRAVGKADHPLIRELVFRDFYRKIYAWKPELQRGIAYRDAMDKHIPWKKDAEAWKAWTKGTTGYPLVDAGMRQLAATGFMHNRVRMVVACFATRYLFLDWRDCMRFFYTQLIDADPFSNTAGWMWSAGIGVDSTPYFRAPMNPFIQSKKFDEQAIYIKRWIPELKDVSPAHIHRWGEEKFRDLYPDVAYPKPIIGQKIASSRSMRVFKEAWRSSVR